MCYFKWELVENLVPHTSQGNHFQPVWVYKQLFKVEWSENADPQTSQENGFSPVYQCVFACSNCNWT